MDLLEPELIWIENDCYRFCDAAYWSQRNQPVGVYEEEEAYEPDLDEQHSDGENIEIVPSRGNRLKHSFDLNHYFYKFIIGAKGSTLKRLEAETSTVITIPRIGETGPVVITGMKRRDITLAKQRIDLLTETSRSKLEFTHFIGIPANTDEIKKNFKEFKEEILKYYGKGSRAITEKLFQTPERLHLTLVMLVLLDKNDRQKAIDTLNECHQNIIKPALEKHKTLELELKGIECMNDDPSEVGMLYIKANDHSGIVQKICDAISDTFIKTGLSRKQYDRVKLHATAMNVRFLSKWDSEPKSYYNKERFDASKILRDFQDTYFGTLKINEIHLIQMHMEGKDGYYSVVSKIEL